MVNKDMVYSGNFKSLKSAIADIVLLKNIQTNKQTLIANIYLNKNKNNSIKQILSKIYTIIDMNAEIPILFCGDFNVKYNIRLKIKQGISYKDQELKLLTDAFNSFLLQNGNNIVNNDKNNVIIEHEKSGYIYRSINQNTGVKDNQDDFIPKLCDMRKQTSEDEETKIDIEEKEKDISDIVEKKIRLIKSSMLKNIYDDTSIEGICKYLNLQDKSKCGFFNSKSENHSGKIKDSIIYGSGKYNESKSNVYKIYVPGKKFTNNFDTVVKFLNTIQ